MPSALLWFRRDLRLADLPALAEAGADGADVLACYVLDPRLAGAGERRLQFLYDSLRELSAALDGRLLVTRGRPETRIPNLARQIGASSVHVSAEFTPFGVRRDTAVRAALGDVELVETGSPYLVSPGRVTKPDGTPYQVFTPYYRRWVEHGWRAPPRTGPASARCRYQASMTAAVAWSSAAHWLASTLDAHNINVHTAKIATLGERVADAHRSLAGRLRPGARGLVVDDDVIPIALIRHPRDQRLLHGLVDFFRSRSRRPARRPAHRSRPAARPVWRPAGGRTGHRSRYRRTRPRSPRPAPGPAPPAPAPPCSVTLAARGRVAGRARSP